MFCVLFRIFFSDNARVRIFIFFVAQSTNFFFQHYTLGYMTKTLNQIIFFPPPKSEYFFQQHCESEYFFRERQLHDRKSRCLRGRPHSSILYSPSGFFSSYFINEVNFLHYKKYGSVGRFTVFGTCVFKSKL